jgi:uncharacterized protein (TIGR02996 family)
MTEREALLRAIRASSEDNLVRLVFADWLDERGEHEEAEFIRLQCELEPIRDRLEDLRARELIRREEVLENHRFGTAFEVGPGLITYTEKLGYRRGLPDWLVISLDNLLKRGDQIFAAYPTIRELAVFDVHGRGTDLAACPLLARLDELEVADSLTPDDAAVLAESSHIRPISQFKLYADWEDYRRGLAFQIADRSTPDWPRRIDMIWLSDGLAEGMEAAECDLPLGGGESYAEPINVVAGRELAQDIRPARRLFPLRGNAFDSVDELPLGIDLGYGMYVGHLPGGVQALFAWGLADWYLVTFEANGIVKAIDQRDCPIPGATRKMAEQVEEAARRWATETLQLRPGVIRARECRISGELGIHLWPRSFSDYFNYHVRPERFPSDLWQERGGAISQWLRKQDFVIDWGNDYWADWKGMIHSS